MIWSEETVTKSRVHRYLSLNERLWFKAGGVATLAEVFCVLGEDGLNIGMKSYAVFLYQITLKVCCLHHFRDCLVSLFST